MSLNVTVGKANMTAEKPYDDIPGTWIFDAQRARLGYHLNQFLYTLMKASNRKAFLADERAYLAGFKLTDAQRQAVLERDWNRLLELGGVVYALAKLAFTDGKSYQYMASRMTGMTETEYVEMMQKGGRSPKGWRSRSEREKH
jgi:protocatechuate 4,5-dioxygenase, alpha chain